MDHAVDIMKSIGLSDTQFYLVNGCVHTRIVELKLYRVQDMILMSYDLSLHFYEIKHAAMPAPVNPRNKSFLSFIDIINLEG